MGLVWLCGLLVSAAMPARSDAPTAAPTAAARLPDASAPATDAQDPLALPQLAITAPEPRYVAPTRRDRIGRIWAPVLINGKGPFRLALDTGASHSAVTAQVAATLGLPLDASPPMMLQGVTGNAPVPSIRVADLTVGDLTLQPVTLPIVTDALGGAEGVLGVEGLGDKRIFIDFLHDLITITRSHNERPRDRFVTVPLERSRLGLIIMDARVDGIPVKAILDTGGQSSIGNIAMRNALIRRARDTGRLEHVIGVTTDEQLGESYIMPDIQFGPMLIRAARVTYGNMQIFEHWKLTHDPVILLGMDTIGLLDTVIIDYRRHEVQFRMRSNANRD
jgi:predicted aspartyl protease